MFVLGTKSLSRLTGVHADLVRVVRRAITLTAVDFTVSEGVRSIDRQRQLVRAGASQTMDSRHLTGHAVDLTPLVAGRARWDWPLVAQVTGAMRQAGLMEKVPIRWGGAWDLLLTDTGDQDPEALMEAYAARRRAAGRKPFMDGPHFELPAALYPAKEAA